MKRTRAILLLVIGAFLAAFLFYPLYYSCREAFFDGSWLLTPGDIQDWPALCLELGAQPRSGPDSRTWALLPADVQRLVENTARGGPLDDSQKQLILDGLNSVLKDPDFYDREAFPGLAFSNKASALLARKDAYSRAAEQLTKVASLKEAAAALQTKPDADKAAAVLHEVERVALAAGVQEAGAPPGKEPDLLARITDLEGALQQTQRKAQFSGRTNEELNRLLFQAAHPKTIARMTFGLGHFSLKFFKYLYTDAVTRQSILNSLALGCVVTVVTAALALPLALVVVRYAFPCKSLLSGLLLVPMIMPPFVGAIGMRQVLARFGSLNLLLMDAGVMHSPIDWLGGGRFWGVVILEVLHLYPIMYLNLAAALANVDPSLEEAAVNLGSSGMRLFRRITLPLMMPGIFAGSVIVFIWAFTDLGTPLVFGYRRVVPVQIFNQVTDLENNPQGYALVVGVLALTLLFFLASKRLFGLKAYQSLSRGPVQGGERRPGWVSRALIVSFLLVVVTAACLPHAAVVLTSLKKDWFMSVLPTSYTLSHFQDAMGHKLTTSSISNSILYSVLSTMVDVVLGVLIAYILVRHSFRGANVLDALVMLPLAVPGLVLAFGYVAAFSGTALDPRENPVPLLVAAYAIRRLPYMVRGAYAGFQQVNVQLEEAAINLGSSPLRAMRRITVPLVSANLIGGCIMVFSFAMLEVSDSLILAMKEQFFPITKAIYMLIQRIEDGPYIASALGVWAMAFLALSLVTAGILLGRRLGQLFRV